MMQGVANTGQIYKMTQQARQAWSMLIVRRSSLIIYNPTSPKQQKGKGKKEKEKGGKEKKERVPWVLEQSKESLIIYDSDRQILIWT